MVEPVKEYVTRKEFNIFRDQINDELKDHSNNIAVLLAQSPEVKELAQALQNVDKNLALMQQNLEHLNKGLEELTRQSKEWHSSQDQKIEELDDKTKIDFVAWLKSKWVEIVVLVALAGSYIKDHFVG